MSKSTWYARVAWVALILIALGISNWSLTHLTDHLGVPLLASLGFSVVFDVGALLFAHRGLRYVTAPRPTKAFGPRLGVLIMVATSATLNAANGFLLIPGRWAWIVAFALGVVPVFASIQFESELKIRFRDTREAAGLSLPSIDGLAWLFFPGTALRTVKAVIYDRLQSIAEHPDRRGLPRVRATALRVDAPAPMLDETAPLGVLIEEEYLPPLEPPDLTAMHKTDAIRHALKHRPRAKAPEVVATLQAHGVEVSEAYVRKVRSNDRPDDRRGATVVRLKG